ncbi:hypothetical protein ACFS3B_10185 [Brucella rhizosphaerae]|uniref:hypothetical protein n=1 Tax=Brucella rhizosphaerae TaxID=571254 RepID=UPI00363E2719
MQKQAQDDAEEELLAVIERENGRKSAWQEPCDGPCTLDELSFGVAAATLFIRSRGFALADLWGALIYIIVAVATIDVNWARAYEGLDRGWRFLQGFLVPNLHALA